MLTYSEIHEQNEKFYEEVKEFLDVEKIKGLSLSFKLSIKENPFSLKLNEIEFSEPKKKKKLEIIEKDGRKRKHKENELF